MKTPGLTALGAESLIQLSWWQVACGLARPLVWMCFFLACVYTATQFKNPFIVYLGYAGAIVGCYFAYSTGFSTTHNLCHGSFRIPGRHKWLSDMLITFYGFFWLYSGHAYRTSHKFHHEHRCGDPRDPEGVSGKKWWSALLFGPVWVARVWWFGLFNAATVRAGVLTGIEICVLAALLAYTMYRVWTARTFGFVDMSMAFYAGEGLLLLWVFPFFSGWVTHWKCRPTFTGQAVNLRWWIWSLLFRTDSYHLLHHMYPTVHSDRLPELHQLPKVKALLAEVEADGGDHHDHP